MKYFYVFLQVDIDRSTEGSMAVHQIVTFVPPKGSGWDKTLEADYYPYSKVHTPGTAGEILAEGTKVGIQCHILIYSVVLKI